VSARWESEVRGSGYGERGSRFFIRQVVREVRILGLKGGVMPSLVTIPAVRDHARKYLVYNKGRAIRTQWIRHEGNPERIRGGITGQVRSEWGAELKMGDNQASKVRSRRFVLCMCAGPNCESPEASRPIRVNERRLQLIVIRLLQATDWPGGGILPEQSTHDDESCPYQPQRCQKRV
jgi:hypothetical protein